MIIAVASGKGGTGKTTISTNLLKVLDEDVRFLDCDVEEPNGHLFINPKMNSQETVYTEIPEIDDEKCTGCRKCVEICRFKALTMVGDRVMVFPELCHSCGGCMLVCPEKAVKSGKRELGIIEHGTFENKGFIKGCMRVGEVMAPPLIDKVRDYENETPVTIIDAPPGTSCPVIAAMRKTDFVLLVTEPTPFGLHDLKLAVETVRTLGLRFGVVINRAGVGDNDVYDYLKNENIDLLMELPFDVEIAKAYSRGELIVDAFPEWKERFLQLYESITEMCQTEGAVQ